MIAYARAHRVEQLTVRPVNLPEESRDPAAYAWTREHLLTARQRTSIENHLASIGTRLQRTSYGAITYDVGGQNVCLTNSLTIAPEADETRQLIFFPDGHIRYDWQHPGAIIL